MCLLDLFAVVMYFDVRLVISASRHADGGGGRGVASTRSCDPFQAPPVSCSVTPIGADGRVCWTHSSRKHVFLIYFLPASALS